MDGDFDWNYSAVDGLSCVSFMIGGRLTLIIKR